MKRKSLRFYRVLNKHWNYDTYLIKDFATDGQRSIFYDQYVHLVDVWKYSLGSAT